MKEFIEKLIGRLKEKVAEYDVRIQRRNGDCYYNERQNQKKLDERARGIEQAIEIVNQLAEEYKSNDNVMQFVKSLKEICCKEDADYDKAIISPKFLCDTVDALVMDFVPQNNGWIPYTTNGELPKEGQRVWLSFTNEVTSYVKDAWWQGKFFVWNNCHIVKDTPTEWKPYDIPAPYQPKGE